VLLLLTSLNNVLNGNGDPFLGSGGVYGKMWLMSQLVWILVALVWMVCFGCKRILQHIGFVQRELLITILATVLVIAVFFGDRWYGTQLLGLEVPGDEECFADTYILLVLANITAVLHLTLPIRWHILVVQEVAVVLVYSVCALTLGNFHLSYQLIIIALLLGLVSFTAMGKRQLERTERAMFRTLVSERTLRLQAEFKLQTADTVPRTIREDTQSVMSTTPSGLVFKHYEAGDEERLATVAEIGQAEQWLVGEEELQLTPDRVLGRGGFGAVVLGLFHGTPVAVKFTLHAQSAKSLASLGNELRILRKLRHPNLCGMHGACVCLDTGDIAMVLELVSGQSLSKYLHSNPKPDGLARAQCLIGVCHGLVYLHSRSPSIVHSDIKPSNIAVQHIWKGSCDNPLARDTTIVNAKLLDFGLARVRTRTAKHLGGTLRYAAPEVFSQSRPPLPQADVYSFGCVVFFAATGEPPLASWKNCAIQKAKRRGVPVLLGFAGTLLLEQSWSLIECATEHHPERRPNMSALNHELLRWPECQQAMLSVDVDADLAKSTLLEQPTSQNFWQQIRDVRQTLAVEAASFALDLADQPRPQPDSQNSEAPKESKQVQAQQPQQPQQQQQRRAGLEVSSSPCLVALPRLAFPGYAETPLPCVMTCILNAMSYLNFQVPQTACCSLHGLTETLESVQQALPRLGCISLGPGTVPSGELIQCRQCLAMNVLEEDEEEDGLECRFCDGAPLPWSVQPAQGD